MKRKTVTNRQGFTITELMVTVSIAIIVVLGLGVVLVDSQRGWNRMYERVHGEIVTDGYVARKTFDSVCRKASIKKSLLDIDGEFVEVYYYQNLSSTQLDRYARFYRSGKELRVAYGDLDANGNILSVSSIVRLARNVQSVNFSITGVCVQMVLKLNNGSEALMVTSSAVRHNE